MKNEQTDLKMYTGSGEDKIGPGHYDIPNFDLTHKIKSNKLGSFGGS